MDLKGKEIVVGVTGGIACYKVPDIIRGLNEAGANVSVLMTQSATEFVRPLVFQAISGRPVATSLFDLRQESDIGHIKISDDADAFVIAPATANIIAKSAVGIADDLLSTALLANQSPLFIAPAMNNRMWEHPTVQLNIATLIKRGATVVDPESGYLACGSYGPGRMAAPERIVQSVLNRFREMETPLTPLLPLSGVSVLVTAGPTREKIDPVRYISNFSSGKMGYALAARCRELGAEVCLISGPTNLSPPDGVTTLLIESAEEMAQAVEQKSDSARLIIKSAAVSDYRIETPANQKIKKQASLELNLTKTKDILFELGKSKTEGQFLVGFAAESENVEGYAKQKLIAKNLDLVVANDISQPDAGFDVDTNRVVLIDHQTTRSLPLMSKAEVAKQILDFVLKSDKWRKINGSQQK